MGLVAPYQVVKSGGEDELFVKTTKSAALSIIENDLKIENILWLSLGSFSYQLDNSRVMSLGEGGQRSEWLIGIIIRLGFILLLIGRDWSILIQLCSDKAENREELGLLVEREVLLAVEMDS